MRTTQDNQKCESAALISPGANDAQFDLSKTDNVSERLPKSKACSAGNAAHLEERYPSSGEYFHAKWVGQYHEVSGAHSCFLSHETRCSEVGNREGVFAEWSWDGERLRVRNDRYGIFPLFYFIGDGEVALSTSITKLLELGAPADLDLGALAVFLRLGFFIGEDTPFRAIRALPPKVGFDWHAGKLKLSGKLILAKPQSISRANAIDGYLSLFSAAIRRRPPPQSDFAIPLSGGRDSRHILLELTANAFRPKFCVTVRQYNHLNDAEVAVASELAKALEVDHVVVEQDTARFREELQKNLRTNFCTTKHAWIMVLADYLNGKTSAIYDGIGGDVLSAGLFLNPVRLGLFESGRLTELADRLLGQESPVPQLRLSDAPAFERDLAAERLVAELERHREAPNPVGSFFFWNRTRRDIALNPYCILGASVQVFSPYLDHELFDFLSSLPAGMMLDHQFHSDAIRHGYPRYAHIPFHEGKAANKLRPTYWSLLRFAISAGHYAVSESPSWVVKQLIPYLAHCALANRNARRTLASPEGVLYMSQLEALLRHTVSSSRHRVV